MSLQIITEQLNSRKIKELFKFKMDIYIIFVDSESGEINGDYTIKIVDRIFNGTDNVPVIERKIGKVKDSYENIMTLINMRINEGYEYQILAEQTDIHLYKPLLEFLGKIDEELISSVIYIDYNHENQYYEIRNAPDENGNTDAIYFFTKDKSLLIFDENGPKLGYDSGITNISDILIL